VKLTAYLPAQKEKLLKKVKLFESYAKIDNWIASPGLQPPT
jgi:hypothetical protein